jgi:hypothetical protein
VGIQIIQNRNTLTAVYLFEQDKASGVGTDPIDLTPWNGGVKLLVRAPDAADDTVPGTGAAVEITGAFATGGPTTGQVEADVSTILTSGLWQLQFRCDSTDPDVLPLYGAVAEINVSANLDD